MDITLIIKSFEFRPSTHKDAAKYLSPIGSKINGNKSLLNSIL